MSRKILRTLGVISFIFGAVLLLNSFSGITGFVIIEDLERNMGSVWGVAFIIVGILLIFVERFERAGLEKRVEKTKEELRRIIKSGRIGSYDELRRIASRLGYELKEDGPHIKVYHDRHLVTEIPRHRKGVATGTYRGIVKALYNETA